jgi:tRNA(Arg) A34 adenosine deaminase TadA
MCLSAIIWANIKKVYYGNTKEDAADIGFRDDYIYDFINKLNDGEENKRILNLKLLNREDALQVFEQYKEDKDKITY